MSVIYDMNQHILGSPTMSRRDSPGDAIGLGLISQEMADELIIAYVCFELFERVGC